MPPPQKKSYQQTLVWVCVEGDDKKNISLWRLFDNIKDLIALKVAYWTLE
jgi:hypothetical protein